MSLKKFINNTTYRGASLHCVKSVQIWSFSGPYLDNFYAVLKSLSFLGDFIYKNILET